MFLSSFPYSAAYMINIQSIYCFSASQMPKHFHIHYIHGVSPFSHSRRQILGDTATFPRLCCWSCRNRHTGVHRCSLWLFSVCDQTFCNLSATEEVLYSGEFMKFWFQKEFDFVNHVNSLGVTFTDSLLYSWLQLCL